jgi:LysM repeat protein
MRGRLRNWGRDNQPLLRPLVALAAGLLVVFGWAMIAPLYPPAATYTGPPPQAPASVPDPVAAADANDAQATPTEQPSPFSAIDQPPPTPAPRVGPVEHTVSSGEVLWQIAEAYRLRPETVLWANDLADPNLLLIGQKLLIPPVDGLTYTVRPGDQLADVANRYGVDLSETMSVNLLSNPNELRAGGDIFLPGGRPLAASASRADIASAATSDPDQTAAIVGPTVPLPDNIDALLNVGWLQARQSVDLYRNADPRSTVLHGIPGGTRLERIDGVRGGRIQVRDPGDGKTRQAMTGWVNAADLDVGRAPSSRELPQAYPADTAMDISHVFAPYRTQLDGSAYAQANCGPTAVGMALAAFGVDVAPRQLRQSALDAQRMYGNGVGTLITALAQVVDQNGLSTYDLRDGTSIRKWSLDDLRGHIAQGHPVVVQVRYRSLPGRGGTYYFGDHYILVTGISGDSFLYNDPIDFDGLGWDRVISGSALHVAMNASDQRYAYAGFAVGP